MRYRNVISYAILLVIAYDIKDIANAIKKISHEISLRYRNDAISHAISHLTGIQMCSTPLSVQKTTRKFLNYIVDYAKQVTVNPTKHIIFKSKEEEQNNVL